MRVVDAGAAQQMITDAVTLAKLEGLHGHAAAAAARLPTGTGAAATQYAGPREVALRSVSTKGWNTSGDRLHIAVPKKGRMHERCMKFLEASGLEYNRPERVDVAQVMHCNT